MPSIISHSPFAEYIVYAFPNSFVLLFVGFLLIAAGLWVFSREASMQMTELVPLALVAVGIAILTSLIFIGQFLSTYYQPILMKAAGLNEMSGSYWIMAAVLGVLWLIDVYMGRAKNDFVHDILFREPDFLSLAREFFVPKRFGVQVILLSYAWSLSEA